MLRVTYCVKNSLYKKEETKQKDKKLGIQRVHKFSESPLMKLTELHRNSCGWGHETHPTKAFSLSVSLSCKVWIQGWGNTEVNASLNKGTQFPSIQKEKSFLSIHPYILVKVMHQSKWRNANLAKRTGPRPQEVMSHTSVCNGKSIANGDRQLMLFWAMWPSI